MESIGPKYFVAIGDTFTPRLFWNGKQFQPDISKARRYPTYAGTTQATRKGSKARKYWNAQVFHLGGYKTLWTISETELQIKGLL